jgi:hypothetical protein
MEIPLRYPKTPSRRNGSLIPVVKREFGTFLAARFGETELNNKAQKSGLCQAHYRP